MTEDPQQPEEDAPQDEAPQEEAPQDEAPQDEAPQDVPAEGGPDEGASGEPGGVSPEPGPEIEGVEELAQAMDAEPAEEAEPAADAERAADAEPTADAEPAAEPEPEGEAAPPAEQGPADVALGERPRPGGRRRQGERKAEEEVIPGAHLEPDLVLEEQPAEQADFADYAEYAEPDEAPPVEEGEPDAAEPAPVAHTPLDLAADARYRATGKRKSAVARVILRPGEGTYSVNGRHLDEYFPRVRLQRLARQPLEAAGYQGRMAVVARIHGGGVSAQAAALRHGIARALVEADPALRGELKSRGYLTRDPRVKERKKAGLKKARKRPQFSKR